MVTHRLQHFIYPVNLEPKSKWTVEIGDGARRTIDLKTESLNSGNLKGFLGGEWGLSSCHRLVTPGDYIWIYAGWSRKRVIAVATATSPAYPATKAQRRNGIVHPYVVNFKIDNDLTLRLQDSRYAITYGTIQRRVQAAMALADNRLAAYLNRWLSSTNSGIRGRGKERTVNTVRREVLQRTGQGPFRDELMRVYEGTCAMTGVADPHALEAAHIRSVSNKGRHGTGNGLLLRADIHTLFDLGLITVDSGYKIHVSRLLTDENYRALNGKRLRLPRSKSDWPSSQLLQKHRSDFGQ